MMFHNNNGDEYYEIKRAVEMKTIKIAERITTHEHDVDDYE